MRTMKSSNGVFRFLWECFFFFKHTPCGAICYSLQGGGGECSLGPEIKSSLGVFEVLTRHGGNYTTES